MSQPQFPSDEDVDEFIETDPDESQHHPIVDDDKTASVNIPECSDSDNENEILQQMDSFKTKEMSGYDTKFFSSNRPSSAR